MRSLQAREGALSAHKPGQVSSGVPLNLMFRQHM